jgi:hypothetical protein
MRTVALCVLLGALASIQGQDQHSLSSRIQKPAMDPVEVSGHQRPHVQVLQGIAEDVFKKPVISRYLLFIASESNFCPSSCRCATGNCEGKDGCSDKFCYSGFVIKTRSDGAFSVPLPASTYEVYVDAVTPERFLRQIVVPMESGENIHLRSKLPLERLYER